MLQVSGIALVEIRRYCEISRRWQRNDAGQGQGETKAHVVARASSTSVGSEPCPGHRRQFGSCEEVGSRMKAP